MNIPQCGDHQWNEVHHYGPPRPPEGDNPDLVGPLLHYCPTGFKQCSICHQIELLENPQCFLWGQPQKE